MEILVFILALFQLCLMILFGVPAFELDRYIRYEYEEPSEELLRARKEIDDMNAGMTDAEIENASEVARTRAMYIFLLAFTGFSISVLKLLT